MLLSNNKTKSNRSNVHKNYVFYNKNIIEKSLVLCVLLFLLIGTPAHRAKTLALWCSVKSAIVLAKLQEN